MAWATQLSLACCGCAHGLYHQARVTGGVRGWVIAAQDQDLGLVAVHSHSLGGTFLDASGWV